MADNKAVGTPEHDTQLNTEIEELDRKPDRTKEETDKLGELKKTRHSSAQKRINELSWREKSAREDLEKERKEREEEKRELAELRKQKETKVSTPSLKKEETVTISGKQYFTDEALISQRDSGEISEADAYQYQRKRDKEEMKAEIRAEQEQDRNKRSDEETRREDANKVLTDYPHFSKNHKDHNPNDPLFKTAMELWDESYKYNPKGFSKSIARAKQILRMSDSKPDLSDDFSTHTPSGGNRPSKEKEVSFSKDEEESSVRMYCRIENPSTRRPYTEAEAITKGKRAKEARLSSRRV